MDRSNAEVSEAFIVQVAPGKFTHRHVCDMKGWNYEEARIKKN